MFRSTTSRLALLHLVGAVRAIVVVVAHPHRRNAFIVIALELAGGTSGRRTAQLVLAQRTVGYFVAAQVRRYAARRDGFVALASELRVQASVAVAVFLVRVVAAIVDSVAEIARVDALSVFALVLSRKAFERRTVGWFVAAVAAVVLGVAFPPERDAFVAGLTLKVRRSAVGFAGMTIFAYTNL